MPSVLRFESLYSSTPSAIRPSTQPAAAITTAPTRVQLLLRRHQMRAARTTLPPQDSLHPNPTPTFCWRTEMSGYFTLAVSPTARTQHKESSFRDLVDLMQTLQDGKASAFASRLKTDPRPAGQPEVAAIRTAPSASSRRQRALLLGTRPSDLLLQGTAEPRGRC